MTRHVLALAAFAAGLTAVPLHARAGVPDSITFTARLVDDETAKAVTGEHTLVFELFDADTGGTSVWTETHVVTVEDGLLYLELGSRTTLDDTVLDGSRRYLSITLDTVVMDPRIPLTSVPYAIRAGVASSADSVTGLDPADLITGVSPGLGLTGGGSSGDVSLAVDPAVVQQRVTGTCTAGSFVTGVGADGTVVCAPDLSGSGDITGVLTPTAGGLTGGAASGDATLSLMTSCGTGQLLKWNGGAWTCANDIDTDTDTNSGGDITGVSPTSGGGLIGGGAAGDVSLGLTTTCGNGQMLKWNGAQWACANDVDTDTNSGGDITDVLAGNGLIGGGATGSLTIDVGVGIGLSVAANAVSLDTAYTDGRYVNATGDTMTGNLNMNNTGRVTNRACPTGYVSSGPGLCVEFNDVGTFTFTAAANRCRAAGTHLCTSAEMRSILQVGTPLGQTVVGDWLDDQDDDDSAIYVNAQNAANPDGTASTSSANYSRCCASVE